MRSVFVTISGFIGRIESETRCAFWVDDPTDHKFDVSRLITVDLAMTPSAAAARQISWDAVQVDDCIARSNGNLGGTTIGPRWPELQLVGTVCLEESLWLKLPTGLRPPSKTMTGRSYEHRTAVYWSHIDDPRAGRRYAGHHAEILAENDTLARVAIYPAGASQHPNARPTTMWIDLASAEQCDAGHASLTEIGVGNAPKQGALFLAVGLVHPIHQLAPSDGAVQIHDLADQVDLGDGAGAVLSHAAYSPKQPAGASE